MTDLAPLHWAWSGLPMAAALGSYRSLLLC